MSILITLWEGGIKKFYPYTSDTVPYSLLAAKLDGSHQKESGCDWKWWLWQDEFVAYVLQGRVHRNQPCHDSRQCLYFQYCG